MFRRYFHRLRSVRRLWQYSHQKQRKPPIRPHRVTI